MNANELKTVIDAIIKNTFKRLETIYNNHKEGFNSNLQIPTNKGSRLVFPSYYKKDEQGERTVKVTRISEQELRFAFVEEFNDYCRENSKNLFYSVETPTKNAYSGFSDEPKQDFKGRSGEFDLVVYDENLKRVCLIEFKANNADEVDHKKDFLKLAIDEKGDDKVLSYFIEIVKSYDSNTINSLKKDKFQFKGKYTNVRCFALEGKRSRKNKNSGEDISELFNDIPPYDFKNDK